MIGKKIAVLQWRPEQGQPYAPYNVIHTIECTVTNATAQAWILSTHSGRKISILRDSGMARMNTAVDGYVWAVAPDACEPLAISSPWYVGHVERTEKGWVFKRAA